jgi:hypothetical protein
MEMIEKDLDSLNFSSFELSSIPDAILNQSWTSRIKSLHLSDNSISKLPGELTGIERLDMR